MFWLVCISLWRGPIPVVHQHALDLQSLSNNCPLAEHAIKFHAEHLGESDSGMHLHFVMCDACASLFAGVGQSDHGHGEACWDVSWDTAFVGAELKQSAENPLTARVLEVQRQPIPFAIAADESPRVQLASSPTSFMQSRLVHTSACALLGVFLC